MVSDDEKPNRGRPRKKSSDAVLDVAMRAYWQADPVDVSINAICQMAGISKPSLYRSFGSEDGLTRAALERYAQTVLSDIFTILQSGKDLKTTLNALMDFACIDPKMETGCLFYKMRAGKHRLGEQTRALVDQIDAAAVDAFQNFLDERRTEGDWTGTQPASVVARFLVEQTGLALTQHAAGEDKDQIRATMAMALSAVHAA